MKKKYCKTCNTATKHSAVADGDEKNGIIRILIPYNDGAGYTSQQLLKDRNNAQAIATEAWNKSKTTPGLKCISVTVGYYTVTVQA